MLSTLAIGHYRSLRQLALPLARLTVITGPNGSGKSSVYRAMRLMADVAQGGVIRSLAREGGLSSTLWAGPERISAAMRRGEVAVQGTTRRAGDSPVRLLLGFGAAEAEGFGYAIDIGFPVEMPSSPFTQDPEIKGEWLWHGPVPRPASLLVERKGAALRGRAQGAAWQSLGRPVPGWASMLTEFADPRSAPEMLTLREQLRSWRFYDHFRSDVDAPARQPQLGTRTPVLSADGADLAAAIETIREIGDAQAFDAAVQDAFPGARVEVQRTDDGRFLTLMRQHGLLRPLAAAELSDGTLRYLLWAAALLSPRPPALLVLNEPETSLHPDLLPALGRLIVRAARDTQVIVVSHANRLIAALDVAADATTLQPIALQKDFGETRIANLPMDAIPFWQWPAR
ncbi:MAG: ATP-binding protein [Comamonadaceae bacterium]|nr:MAG: ATP-binding protein [Comamonadaceae bacterium]